MALLQMRFLPDPILRTQAKKISKIPSTLPKFTDDMVETMIHEHGVGLAANQVGSLQKVCVIQLPEWEEAIVLINPEITEAEGEVELEEGCLSLPGYRGITLRSEKVKVKALGLDGKAVRIQTEGLFSQALQHEIDHLNGILYIDRLVSKDEFYKIQFDDEGNAEYVQINKDSELS
ncbi:MAG: peptide deformylase [SAR202 cluster bacterium]|nr:peptide deformylase [Dehalococcoidia bacterium]MQG08245.1 peptide deformylase [SAR202 cluster bacterium]CAI8287093.1 MAG: Peptide deformylase [Chloroflexota bacterium]MQG17448.1 peptide deformylase [SAR202 cluster bacterium]MQG36184.1 peptide deformylase [SAR202 cluster bacterium]